MLKFYHPEYLLLN
jgi:hypothetical protein